MILILGVHRYAIVTNRTEVDRSLRLLQDTKEIVSLRFTNGESGLVFLEDHLLLVSSLLRPIRAIPSFDV